jgi:septal ring factor EnvC (AmiA/AmiB activator)
LLNTPPAGVNAAKHQLSNSLSVLHSAVAAAVLASAAECEQTAVLGRQVEGLQEQLQQAAAGQQELRGQFSSLQEQLAVAEREADAVKMQLQEVGVGLAY